MIYRGVFNALHEVHLHAARLESGDGGAACVLDDRFSLDQGYHIVTVPQGRQAQVRFPR